ncbi:two-component system response regulator [Gemmatimonadetes bacterium T265]|nr:two-component system response regulator [Gemmatimonadetes bacterium T265]
MSDPVRVLVVDDEETIRLAIGRFLERRGYTISAASDAAAALRTLEGAPAGHYALMLCDVRMPGMNGVDLVPRVRAIDPALAVVMLSAVDDAASARAAFTAGAVDYLVKPVELAALEAAVEDALRRRALELARRSAEDAVRDELAVQDGAADKARRAAAASMRATSLAVAEALVAALEAKDPYAGGRAARVSALAASIAAELGFDEDMVESVRLAARLHDVGTIGVRDEVLHKPGPLTPEERGHVREHVRLGLAILAPLGAVPGMHDVMAAVADHHERWDGAGYPRAIVGAAIAPGGRVLAAADTWDAVTSARSYQGAMAPEAALEYLGTLVGGLLDPAVYAALATVVRRGEALSFLE